MNVQPFVEAVKDWWLEEDASREVRESPAYRLRYGNRYRRSMAFGVVFWLFWVVFSIWAMPTDRGRWVSAGLFACFLLPTLMLYLEAATWRADIDPKGVRVHRLLRPDIRFRWEAVLAWRYSSGFGWYVVEVEGQPKLRISDYVPGLGRLTQRIRQAAMENLKR